MVWFSVQPSSYALYLKNDLALPRVSFLQSPIRAESNPVFEKSALHNFTMFAVRKVEAARVLPPYKPSETAVTSAQLYNEQPCREEFPRVSPATDTRPYAGPEGLAWGQPIPWRPASSPEERDCPVGPWLSTRLRVYPDWPACPTGRQTSRPGFPPFQGSGGDGCDCGALVQLTTQLLFLGAKGQPKETTPIEKIQHGGTALSAFQML